MGFAQVLIQARGEGAAHNGVQDLEREPVGGRARRAHVADPDHGLRGSWFVDQIQGGRRRWRGGRVGECGYLAPLPAAEPRGREPAYFGERDVAHDQQARPVGPVVRPIELCDALAREPGGGAVGAVQRVPVRMLATVHDRGERDVRNRVRLPRGPLGVSTAGGMGPFGGVVVWPGGGLRAGGGGNGGGLVGSTWGDGRSGGPGVGNPATPASTRLARPTPTTRPPVRRSAL